MVNENDNVEPTPKKRPRLFGARRPAGTDAAPAVQPEATEPRTPARRPAAKSASDHVSARSSIAADAVEPAAPAQAAQKPTRQKAVKPEAEAGASGADAPEARGEAKRGSTRAASAKSGDQGTEATAEKAPARRSSSKKQQPAGDVPTETTAPTRGRGSKSDEQSAGEPKQAVARPTTSLIFQAPDLPALPPRAQQPRRDEPAEEVGTVRRRSRRRPGEDARPGDEAPNTVVRVRQPRPEPVLSNEPTRVKGSTRLEAKKQRRRDGRDAGRRRPVVTESEFLARRESVDRVMVVRSRFNRIQIAVLEDGVLVEHYVAKAQDASLIGNVYLGRVQNVLPSMEAAFVDIGRGRNAVLYSGEVDWDAAAAEGDGKNQARRIELALKPGDRVLVQVTKDPVGHKGARLTSQVSLPGRYLVYVPNGSMSGISRKLPDTERARLKKILKEVLPENVGVIVRTAAEGATEEQLTLDVQRLTSQWAEISRQVETVQAPALLHSEPDLLIKIVRDVFNEDFHKLVVAGDDAKETIEGYLSAVAPDLADRVESYDDSTVDSFDAYRVTEQIEKALDRKVWLPSGGSLVIDRTEAMTVVDVNTGKFVGSGGNLEETVTKNNLEAAEEIVRQLRLRDIGGIIVIDFIDMVLESNRDLVLRRLVECLSRDRTKHQVAEVTSLGLVQMTRKKLGLGLLETFSEPCETCAGRGIVIHHDPVMKHRVQQTPQPEQGTGRRSRNKNSGGAASAPASGQPKSATGNGTHAITEDVRHALAQIAASTVAHAHDESADAAAASPSVEPAASAAPAGSRGRARAAQAAPQAAAAEPTPAADEAEAHIAILDIPVAKAARQPRRISTQDAEQILDSVLESLPEPKQPGQGRSRVPRRAGSAGQIVSAPTND